jgi:predicted ATPase
MALVAGGQAEAGIVQLREGLGSIQALGIGDINIWGLGFLGAACGILGRLDQGFAALMEALTIVENTSGRVYEAELYRLKGELTLMSPEAVSSSKAEEEAESYFCQAIEIARRQGAKLWELRAATSLARLLAKENRRDEARAILAEIYNRFTEGFDTTDLKEAKALLAELTE